MLINYSAHQNKQARLMDRTHPAWEVLHSTHMLCSSLYCAMHTAKPCKKFTLLIPLHRRAGRQRAQKKDRKVGPLGWWVCNAHWTSICCLPQDPAAHCMLWVRSYAQRQELILHPIRAVEKLSLILGLCLPLHVCLRKILYLSSFMAHICD